MTAQTFADIPARAINDRDRALLTWLAAVKTGSENQLVRHFWAATTASAARRRLRQLTEQYRLLRPVTVDPVQLAAAGLELGPVYELTPLGRDWLRQTTGGEAGYESKPAQYLHDLLVAEISVRLAEIAGRRGPGWTSDWFGEADIRKYAPKGLVPDGFGLLRRPDSGAAFAFFLELDASRESHGRHSSQIGLKVGGYDRYAETWAKRPGPAALAQFPPALFVTHGAERLANLAADIREHRRRQPVAYGLALLDELLAAPDMLAASAWRLLPADAKQPDQLNQSLLGDTRWLMPPAKPAPLRQTAPPPAEPAPPPPPAEPLPKPQPTPAAIAPPPKPAAPPPISQPPPPVTPEPPRHWRQSDRLPWLLLLVFAMLALLTPATPLYEVRDWLNAPPTATPTATPELFRHVPTATPFGGGRRVIYPGYSPLPLLSTPPASR